MAHPKRRDIQAATLRMGREPVNPVGECFESSIRQFLFAPDCPADGRLCHGVGIANLPGEEGLEIGHAWVEFSEGMNRLAMDTTWGTVIPAEVYRKTFQLRYYKEYTQSEAEFLWKMRGYPGPWDEEIFRVTESAPALKV